MAQSGATARSRSRIVPASAAIERENVALHSALAEAVLRIRRTMHCPEGHAELMADDLMAVLDDPDHAPRPWEARR